jgi:hypothetical protein
MIRVIELIGFVDFASALYVPGQAAENEYLAARLAGWLRAGGVSATLPALRFRKLTQSNC